MSTWQIFILAIALGCDAFSVALCVGSHKRFPGQKFRLGFHFGLFQMLMFLIGFGVGCAVVDWVRTFDHWIASILVGMVAFHMLIEALNGDEGTDDIDYSRSWYLVSLSVATSIDALAVGFALGLTGIPPFTSSLIIGITAGVMAVCGVALGRRLRSKIGRFAELGGGIVLFLIAIKLFHI